MRVYIVLSYRKHLLCNPLAQLTARRVRVGREDDQATLGVVHISGVLAAALPTLRQWIPGHPRCAEPFLQWRVTRQCVNSCKSSTGGESTFAV